MEHDKKVEELASICKRMDHSCKANLEEWEKPENIGVYTPDIIARKNGDTLIIEVTEDQEEDKEKIDSLREYAEKRKNTRFRLEKI